MRGSRARGRRHALVGAVLAALLAGCGVQNPSASPANATSTSSIPAATERPAPSVAAAGTTPAPSIPRGASGGIASESRHGLTVTFPSGWIVLVPSVARDLAAIEAMKARLDSNAGLVDELALALREHPEYWLTAAQVSDASVVTAELRPIANADSWSSQEQALLARTFGRVQTSQVSSPRTGVVFTYLNQGFATRVYGFPRPGGVVVFSFTATSTYLGAGWDGIVATFGDMGK